MLATSRFGTSDTTLFSKAQAFGFSFDKALLPDEDALISLLAECANDGIALAANFESKAVPEPTTITGLAFLGLALVGGKLRKKA